MVPIGKLKPSPTNPRKHFAPAKQDELMNLMREHGFTSTLLLRACPDIFFIDEVNAEAGQIFVMRKTAAVTESVEMCPTLEKAQSVMARLEGSYEVVDGHRRLLAARGVGFEKLPCIIRQLSDKEVLEIQLSENGEPLTAIEEAEGLTQALALRDAEGNPQHTCTTLAKKIGKSVRHVERRVKLVELNGEARKAVEDGFLPANTALLIARIPDEKLREKATKEILHPTNYAAPLSLRQSEELVQREFMCDLRAATFDQADATLLPVETDDAGRRKAGGACTDCPFKLGNATNLAPGDAIPSGMHNMCLNPRCFERKKEGGWRQWQEEQTDAARKRRALTEAECKKLYRYGDQLEWNCGYVDLSDRPDTSDLKPGVKAPGTWRQMTKDAGLEVLVVRDRNQKQHELVSRELAVTAAKANEHDVFKTEKKGGTAAPATSPGARPVAKMSDDERRAAELERLDEEELDEACDNAVAAAVAEKAGNGKPLPAGFWPEVFQQIMEEYYGEAPDRFEGRRGWKAQSAVAELVKLQPHHQLGALAEFMFFSARVDTAGPDEARFLKMFGIDAKAIEKNAGAEVKARQKRRKELRADISRLAINAGLTGKKRDEKWAEVVKLLKLDKSAKPETINDVGVLEKIAEALKKTAPAALPKALDAAGAPKAAQKPAGKKTPAKKAKGLSADGRAKLAAAMKKRWDARKKGVRI